MNFTKDGPEKTFCSLSKEINCLVCENIFNKNEFYLPCKCYICKVCFIDWIISENKENEFSYEGKFICPNHKCKEKFEYSGILTNLSPSEQEKINDILLKKYMNNCAYTRRCPKSNCPYGGWMDYNIDSYENCGDSFICDLCGNEWVEESLRKYNYNYFLKNIFNNFKGLFSGDLSEINVRLSSKPCPRCYIQIYKFSGCDHMKCPKCELDYCYNCNRSHSGNNLHCNLKYFADNIIFSFFFFILLWKLSLSINIVYLIMVYSLWFILINVGYIIYFAYLYSGLVSALYIICCKELVFMRNKYGKILLTINFISTCLILLLHLYFYFFSETVKFYTKILFWEIIMIGSLYILISIIIMLKRKR